MSKRVVHLLVVTTGVVTLVRWLLAVVLFRHVHATGVFSCMQSDHRPVHAVFLLRTRLPFVVSKDAARKPFTCVYPPALL